jgi:hypothetical protein
MSEAKKKAAPTPDAQPETKRKVIVTGRMDPDLMDRAKAMAYWTPGLTPSRLIEVSLQKHLAELEEERGKPKPAPGPLRNGRPLKMGGGR